MMVLAVDLVVDCGIGTAALRSLYEKRTVWRTSLLLLVLLAAATTTDTAVTVAPTDVVAGLGGDATFVCVSPSTPERVEWMINGSSLDNLQLRSVTQEFVITLRFRNMPVEYNNTRIQCIADAIPSSENSTLLVQGLLSAVGHLLVNSSQSFFLITWTAPFTLDISTTSQDISGYCVDVVSSTSSATLHSECGIIETEFTYPLPPRSWCDEYIFTVTPVNVAGNGTLQNIRFPPADSLFLELDGVIATTTNFSLFMSAPVCNVELIIEDIYNFGGRIVLGNNDLDIRQNTITALNSRLLTENRNYNVRVSASNFRASLNTEIEISTHDITSCISSSNVNGISVVVNFTQHSHATGALLYFIFIDENDTVDFSKSFCQAADKNTVLQGLVLPLDLWFPGQYVVYAYDIEINKMVMDGLGYEASNGNISMMEGQDTTPPLRNGGCSITCCAGVITVVCPFTRFQVTAQSNANVNILHVSTSMDPQTPATVQVPENGEYLVTVLPIQDGRGILSGAGFSQVLMVTDVVMPTLGCATNSSLTTSLPGTSVPSPAVIGAVVGGLLAAIGLVIVVVVVTIVVVLFKSTQRMKNSKESYNMYISHGGRTSSITRRPSRSGPATTTSMHEENAAYAMVHDVLPQIRDPSPPPAYSTVPGSVAAIIDAPVLGTAQEDCEEPPTPKVPLYSVVNKPKKDTMSSLPPSKETGSEATSEIPLYGNLTSNGTAIECDTAETDFPSEPTSATSKESQGETAHYVALDHPAKPVSSDDVINTHNIEYAVATGYQTQQNQKYAFVDWSGNSDKGRVFEISKGISDDVVYTEITPHVPRKDIKEPSNAPANMQEGQTPNHEEIQDERSTMWDAAETTPLLGPAENCYLRNRIFPRIFHNSNKY